MPLLQQVSLWIFFNPLLTVSWTTQPMKWQTTNPWRAGSLSPDAWKSADSTSAEKPPRALTSAQKRAAPGASSHGLRCSSSWTSTFVQNGVNYVFFFGFVYNGKRILSKFPEFTAANTPTPKVNSPSHRAKLHLCFNLANNRLTTSNNHIASLADVTKLNQQPLESNENKQTRKHFLKFSSDITSAPSADLNRCSSAWKHTLNFVLVRITNSSYKSEKTMSKIVSVLSKYKHKCKHLVIRLLN